MIDSLYIAWKYIGYNRLRTVILVGCITLISFLPVALQRLLNESERQLMSRAATTPLVIGAKGSSLDLVMNSLYFSDEAPELITMKAPGRVMETGLAKSIPLYIRFHARGFPIVGTQLDYFDFRNLEIGQGRNMAVLGECVAGAAAAERLGINPGDSLMSSPENLFDLAGIYPLKMRVAGILKKTHTSDDLGIFVDLKTAWVIEGLGHGHTDVTKTRDTTVILNRTDSNVTANAKLEHYMEITEDNINTFHFHGGIENNPITAVIAVPDDVKSGTILQGRFLAKDETHQIVKPADVIDTLLQNIFRIKNVLDAVILVVGMATVLAIILVFALSLRLRAREIKTIFRIGCSRMTVVRLVSAEIGLIVLFSAVLCIAMIWIVDIYAHDLVRILFIR